MVRKIILDTNFLLIPVQFGVDIFSEFDRICNFKYELVVVPETVTELEGIINGKGSKKDKMAAGTRAAAYEEAQGKDPEI